MIPETRLPGIISQSKCSNVSVVCKILAILPSIFLLTWWDMHNAKLSTLTTPQWKDKLPNYKMGQGFEQTSLQKRHIMTNECMKRGSIQHHQPSGTWKPKKPRRGTTSHPSGWQESRRSPILSIGKDVETLEPLSVADGTIKWCSHFGQLLGSASRCWTQSYPMTQTHA